VNENDRERKISAEQMAIMMYPVVGTGIISVPAVMVKYTKKKIFWLKYNR
jgi:hypothetical protein